MCADRALRRRNCGGSGGGGESIRDACGHAGGRRAYATLRFAGGGAGGAAVLGDGAGWGGADGQTTGGCGSGAGGSGKRGQVFHGASLPAVVFVLGVVNDGGVAAEPGESFYRAGDGGSECIGDGVKSFCITTRCWRKGGTLRAGVEGADARFGCGVARRIRVGRTSNEFGIRILRWPLPDESRASARQKISNARRDGTRRFAAVGSDRGIRRRDGLLPLSPTLLQAAYSW